MNMTWNIVTANIKSDYHNDQPVIILGLYTHVTPKPNIIYCVGSFILPTKGHIILLLPMDISRFSIRPPLFMFQ